MFNREILSDLRLWADKPRRKPLVIRGARQVGKKTVVNRFAEGFDNYLYFNLELSDDRKLFYSANNFENLLRGMFFLRNMDTSISPPTAYI